MDAASVAYETIGMIARDETRHAAVAWATLRWAWRKGAVVSAPTHGAAHVAGDDAESALLRSGRQASSAEAAQVRGFAWSLWVGLWAAALVRGRELPVVVPADGAIGSVVVHAAAAV